MFDRICIFVCAWLDIYWDIMVIQLVICIWVQDFDFTATTSRVSGAGFKFTIYLLVTGFLNIFYEGVVRTMDVL